jgi:DNA-binding MarR family transcriptional regulator
VTKYSPDSKFGRLLPLHEKVTRIAQSLARSSLATIPSDPQNVTSSVQAGEISEEAVSNAIRAWRERSNYLPGELFSDPAWGMLLELLQAEIEQRRVSLSRLCNVSAVSATSAIRWLKTLENRGLVFRRADDISNDFVELTPKGSSALRCYFHDVAMTRTY